MAGFWLLAVVKICFSKNPLFLLLDTISAGDPKGTSAVNASSFFLLYGGRAMIVVEPAGEVVQVLVKFGDTIPAASPVPTEVWRLVAEQAAQRRLSSSFVLLSWGQAIAWRGVESGGWVGLVPFSAVLALAPPPPGLTPWRHAKPPPPRP